MILPASEIKDTLYQLFLQHNFSKEQAELLANTHTASTLDGVNSHGVDRVPLFIKYVRNGWVKVDAEAKPVQTLGSIERWDGNLAAGVLNAIRCTERAVELAKQNGMGLVALRNTNHWMRGGTYGWQAADAGCISILFTNTQPNMPAWGGRDSRVGNNPLVVSIPRTEGHVVLDMALSQFSFGKINSYRLNGEQLPYPGGWDDQNELSKDPEKILQKERGLPIGYWKGSALSMVLDMLATLLSAGDSTYRIGQRPHETGISQIFLCIYPALFGDKDLQERLLQEIIQYTHAVEPMRPGERTYYPGERTMQNRKRNQIEGVPVKEAVWREILDLIA